MARILITRPLMRADDFACELQSVLEGCEIILSPIFETVFLGGDIPEFETAIFTSQTGVEAFLRTGARPSGRRALCVGAQTTKRARGAGFRAQMSGGDVEALLGALLSEASDGVYLHFCSTTPAGALSEHARAGGKRVVACEIYAQHPCALTPQAGAALRDSAPLILPIFSARAGGHLRGLLHGVKICNTFLIAMSEAVFRQMEGGGFADHIILEKPTRARMIEAIKRLS